jgi:DNA-binding NarL/FixJ family response regulator
MLPGKTVMLLMESRVKHKAGYRDMVEIFLVDPHHITRSGLVSVLAAESDINVCGHVGSLENCADLVIGSNAELIVVDLPLLGAMGVELIQRIQSVKPSSKTVVLSADAKDENLLEALRLGVHAYILKGTSIELLMCALRAVECGATWMDPVIARRWLDFISQKCINDDSSWSEKFKNGHTAGPMQEQTERVDSLSQREIQVVSLLTMGLGNRQIAVQLCVSTDTVKTHIRHIFEKLNATSRTDAAIKAIRAGYCEPTPALMAC